MSGEGDVKGPPGPGEEYEEIREQVCQLCFSMTDQANSGPANRTNAVDLTRVY